MKLTIRPDIDQHNFRSVYRDRQVWIHTRESYHNHLEGESDRTNDKRRESYKDQCISFVHHNWPLGNFRMFYFRPNRVYATGPDLFFETTIDTFVIMATTVGCHKANALTIGPEICVDLKRRRQQRMPRRRPQFLHCDQNSHYGAQFDIIEEYQKTSDKWFERMKFCIEHQGNCFKHLM